jgi:hypothetical protein
MEFTGKLTNTEDLQLTSPVLDRDSVVCVVTGYWMDGPEIESRWEDIFRTRPERPWGPPSLLCNVNRVFPGDKSAGAWS